MLRHAPDTGTAPPSGGERSVREARAAAALALVAVLVGAVSLLGLAVRPPVQRSSMLRNLECLRCHPEMLPRLSEASVHQPFATRHCTSCHGRHGQRRETAWRRQAGPLLWLQVRLDELGMRLLWDGLSVLGLVRDQGGAAGSASTTETAGTAGLVVAETELCWQCHGGMGPQLGARVLHPPFERGQCTSCHDPHASATRSLLHAEPSELCPSCHRVAEELLAADVHLPFGERDCVACHDPHASDQAGLLVRRERDLCLGCHGEVAALEAAAVRHAPFATGTCTSCHRPHSAAFAALLPAPSPELCYRCHPSVRTAFAAGSRHPLPGRVRCEDCHAAHASAHAGLLTAEQRTLCLGCHGAVAFELQRRNVHEVAGGGPCTACHVPHGSRASPLLQQTEDRLCPRCHPNEAPSRRESAARPRPARGGRAPARPARAPSGAVARPTASARASGMRSLAVARGRVTAEAAAGAWRPVGPDASDPLPSEPPRRGDYSHPLPAGRRCTSCHEAHASDNQVLLRASGDALCLDCHAFAVPAFASSGHAGLSCRRCHRIHSAPYRPQLADRNPEVCLRCHKGYADAGSSHPVDPAMWDPVAWTPLTCTSTCHDPHGSDNYRMLRVRYNSHGYGSDYICLLCHTGVGIDY